MESSIDVLRRYASWQFGPDGQSTETSDLRKITARLGKLSQAALSLTQSNQLLHLAHQAGMSQGFFRYYFLTAPDTHPYPVDLPTIPTPTLQPTHIASMDQLVWGLERFFIDGLLFYGNFRSAYRDLRTRSFDDITDHYRKKRHDTESMQLRGPILPLKSIPVDDRYLISELAATAYGDPQISSVVPVIEDLVTEYKKRGDRRMSIRELVDATTAANEEDFQKQLAFPLATEEVAEEQVRSEEEIRATLGGVLERYRGAREKALENTQIYMSFCNELDVYIATSMRNRSDFRSMAENTRRIFYDPLLQPYCLRYFDPTISAARCHEDKGIIECLMVKQAKMVVYFAQEHDSWGKDSEAAMALSLGKPVVIFCPPTDAGRLRMKMLRDVHPLSRLIDLQTGVAVGAYITDDINVVVQLIDRIFGNKMQYEMDHNDGYYRLRESLTGSVVRLVTNDRMITETFWNYFHGVS